MPPIGATLVGWYGREESGARCVYLMGEPCVQQAREYWLKAGESFDTVPKAVAREMDQAGVLIRNDESQFESPKRIRGLGTKRVLVVDVAKLARICGAVLWPEEIEKEG